MPAERDSVAGTAAHSLLCCAVLCCIRSRLKTSSDKFRTIRALSLARSISLSLALPPTHIHTHSLSLPPLSLSLSSCVRLSHCTPLCTGGFAYNRTIAYFPSKPKHAPSISASQDRTAYWKGFGEVVKNKQFWFLACAYGLMTGVYSGWGSFLAPNLEKVTDPEKAQKLSAYLGFYATLAGCVGGVGASLGSDYLGGKMKVILLALSAGKRESSKRRRVPPAAQRLFAPPTPPQPPRAPLAIYISPSFRRLETRDFLAFSASDMCISDSCIPGCILSQGLSTVLSIRVPRV